MLLNVEKIGEINHHRSSVYTLEKAAKSNLIYSGSSDKSVLLWNLSLLKGENFTINMPEAVYSICFDSQKNNLYLGGESGKIYFVDLTERKEFKILHHHSGIIFSLHKTEANLVAASGDGNISVVELTNYLLTHKIELCKEKVRDIDSKNNKIAIACGDGSIRILDSTSFNEIKRIEAHQLSCNVVKFHPSSNLLISGGRDAHLRVWDIENEYKLVKEIPAHNFAIYDLAFSPNKNLFATASRDKTIKIWDANSFEILVRINKEKYEGHINSVNTLCWSNYNNYLLSSGDDKKIMIWNVSEQNS